jgi:hypothetical protein
MLKIFTIAHVPDSLAQAWLQHMRNFDDQHEGCHFEIAADAPNLTIAEITEIIKINPQLTVEQIFRRNHEDDD